MYSSCSQCTKRVAMILKSRPVYRDAQLSWYRFYHWDCMYCDASGMRELHDVEVIPGVL